MHFSDGIEPQTAKGLEHQIGPGKVVFSPIPRIDPGQEMTFEVLAEATTRYFGDSIDPPATSNDSRSANTGDQLDGNSFR